VSAIRRARRRLRIIPATWRYSTNNGVVIGGQLSGELVEAVSANVGDAGVRAGEASSGLPPTGRWDSAGAVGSARTVATGELPVKPPQPLLGLVEWAGVGDRLTGGQYRQMPDANVNAYDFASPRMRRDAALDFDSEAHVPAVAGAGDGSGEDAGGALFEAASKLAGGFMSPDPADAWQHNVVAVGFDADRAGGKSAGGPGTVLGLAPGKADPAAGTSACPGIRPVLQPACQGVQARAVGLFGVLWPPGGGLVLGAVPLPAQRWQRPRHLDV
jgi:hypothetical protein